VNKEQKRERENIRIPFLVVVKYIEL